MSPLELSIPNITQLCELGTKCFHTFLSMASKSPKQSTLKAEIGKEKQ